MRAVKSSNTAPELTVRAALRKISTRFRVNSRDLPGTPDIVLRRRKLAIFVHGCFWHGHKCKRGSRVPKTNQRYWKNKVYRNQLRDVRVRRALTARGWRSLIVWECQTNDAPALSARLRRFLIC